MGLIDGVDDKFTKATSGAALVLVPVKELLLAASKSPVLSEVHLWPPALSQEELPQLPVSPSIQGSHQGVSKSPTGTLSR